VALMEAEVNGLLKQVDLPACRCSSSRVLIQLSEESLLRQEGSTWNLRLPTGLWNSLRSRSVGL